MNDNDDHPSLTVGSDIWKQLAERRLSKIPQTSHSLFLFDEEGDVPVVFSELDKYVINDKNDPLDGHWKEVNRWIKFEEIVDEGGKRWSKPHVPILNANNLFQLKEHFLRGPVYLDVKQKSMTDILEFVLQDLIKKNQITKDKADLVTKLILSRIQKGLTKNKNQSTKNDNNASTPLIDNQKRKTNKRLFKKIPEDAEATNIFVSQIDFLDSPLVIFIRLENSILFDNVTEVEIPTKFIFIALTPKKGDIHSHELGRAMGVLMSDELFRKIVYKTKSNTDIKFAVSEYIHNATLLPPCSLHAHTRIEPVAVATKYQRAEKFQKLLNPLKELNDDHGEGGHGLDPALKRTGKFGGGLIADIKRKAKWYISDYTDSFNLECVSSFCFMYFALLSPIVTFGGLLEEATGKRMAALENLFSGAICGIAYHMFSGQPLTIIGSTGPVLVFETIMFDMCTGFGWDYLSFRTWVNLWTAIYLLIITFTDSSAMVAYITRFTEESFAALIAIIFIYESFAKLIKITDSLDIIDMRIDGQESCYCSYNNLNSTTNLNECKGELIGSGCYIMYDKLLMSIVLMTGTFILSIGLKKMRTSGYLPSKFRAILSDFAVIISICVMTIIDIYIGINTPKLTMPSSFTPTYSDRGWLIPLFNGNPVYTAFFAAIPALLLCILIFLDQQITAVIVNRKENKLKKGCGYHLDLFILALLIIVVGYLGIPVYVAATVLSINHVNSLKIETESLAPGEPQQFLGVREQRVTGIVTFILIGVSVFMTKLLCHIPMPVLYGVFLYMGISALATLDFWERICIMFMPMKYQPDRGYIRHVPIKSIHIFTVFQITCLALLWIVKSIKSISIGFPIMLIIMIIVRKLMEFFFNPKHLHYLDDPMPPICGKKDDSADVESICSTSSKNEIQQDRRLSLRYSHLLDEKTSKCDTPTNEKNIPLIVKDDDQTNDN